MRTTMTLTAAAAICVLMVGGEHPTSPDEPVATGATFAREFAGYPDAKVRRLNLLAAESRPVEPSAMPPRHLDTDTFPEALIDRTQIVSGGPPPDGIPSIDAPVFEDASDVDWLSDDEAVLAVGVGDVERAYPIQIMTWHEIVNDEFAGIPVTVTYCPLCNSAVAFDRSLDGEVLDFGTSGSLYRSALVMYDRQTETLWTHFDGRAVVGTLVGAELDRVPVATVPWNEWRNANPDGEVLSRDTGYDRDYGRNRYIGYDQLQMPLSGFLAGGIDARAEPMQRVVGIGGATQDLAISLEHLRARSTLEASIDGRTVTIWHTPGVASPLQRAAIDGGDDIGTTAVFATDVLDEPRSFERVGGRFVHQASGSSFDLFGRAVAGPLAGLQLERVTHLDTFWFAWSSYHPDSELLG
jgi:hypothetical protein